MTANEPNRLYFGDNLEIMREHIADDSVDLIYLDPPFNSNATYNVLFREHGGDSSAAQITAFEDTWRWDIQSEIAFRDVVQNAPSAMSDLLQSMRSFLGQSDMMAYLTMMSQRMNELQRVLKPTGSIYLHCDPTASHYLKLLMDATFGVINFRNEIVWRRTGAHGGANRWGRIHDTILFYTASDDYTWNNEYQPYDQSYLDDFYIYEDDVGRFRLVTLTGPGTTNGDSGQPWRGINPTDQDRHWALPMEALRSAYPEADLDSLTTQQKLDLLDDAGLIYWPPEGSVPQQKRYADESPGVPIQDFVYDIKNLGSRSRERLGFQTQKPEKLLERIIRASSNGGDVVLDPFCGCGTALAAAERLDRRWIGIDITHLAVSLIRHRLSDTFGSDLREYEVIGEPKDVASAQALADQNRHQFEWWALSLVDARPARDRRKRADSGIDGYINFFDDNGGKPRRIVVQVKSGRVNRGMVATLKGDMERENADLALFITLNEPTEPMRQEALSAGIYEPKRFPDKQYQRVQILTVEELLSGTVADYPRMGIDATFSKAQRQRRRRGQQAPLG